MSWEELNEKLPWLKTEEERQKRIQQWALMDMNNNGYMSLAEIDKGMRDVIQLPILFDLKPVLMRAFMAAKTKKAATSQYGDDYITKGEYRYLLKFLRQFYEYWLAFECINLDDDRRLSHDEFMDAVPHLEKWGIDMSDPEAQWQQCDTNGEGMVLFIEFCDWANRRSLDLEDDDNYDSNE